MGRLRRQLRGAAAEGGKAAPEKEFMYGTLSRFKLRHTRGGKAALRPLTKISRISIIKRFLGSIFVLFCTPKKHITDVTFVFLTAFPVVTASRFCTRGCRFTRVRLLLFTFAKNVFVVTCHKIATAASSSSRDTNKRFQYSKCGGVCEEPFCCRMDRARGITFLLKPLCSYAPEQQ